MTGTCRGQAAAGLRSIRAMPIDESLAFVPIRIAVATISDTRTPENDTSGKLLVQRLTDAGHELAAHRIVSDDVPKIVACLQSWIEAADVDVVITTGGTGLTGRDSTPEALAQVGEKEIVGFGELFRWISFSKIGTSTVQSRATAWVANGTYLFALPGSTGACRDGWDEILSTQLDIRHRPCNFVELIPRLKER